MFLFFFCIITWVLSIYRNLINALRATGFQSSFKHSCKYFSEISGISFYLFPFQLAFQFLQTIAVQHLLPYLLVQLDLQVSIYFSSWVSRNRYTDLVRSSDVNLALIHDQSISICHSIVSMNIDARLMTMSFLYPCGKPCSTGTHNE